jgi:predicted RNA-binding Zn-ribbon protein involved in translation (DUF1610 family)
MFFIRLQAKAEEAGRQVVRVNPALTSQPCSACGHRQPMPRSLRVYECPHCGLVIHRDHNGSLNILADAQHAVGRHSRVRTFAPGLQPWGVVTTEVFDIYHIPRPPTTVTARDRRIEPLLLSLTNRQECSASKATCSLFSPGKHPRVARDDTQEHDSSKSK